MSINQNRPGLLNPIQFFRQARQPGGLLAPVTSVGEAVRDPRLFIADALINRTPITTAIGNYATVNKALAPEETETFSILTEAEKAVAGLDPNKVYQKADATGKISQVGTEGNIYNIGEQSEAKINLERSKRQFDAVENDIEDSKNYVQEAGFIRNIEAGNREFVSGAFGNTRKTLGSIVKLVAPDADLGAYFNPESGELIEAGAANLQRELMRGLGNLNIQEVKITAVANANLLKQPSTNQAMIETYKINNRAKEQSYKLAQRFLAGTISYEDYQNEKIAIKDKATEDANLEFETLDKLNDALQKELKKGVGTTVIGRTVRDEAIYVQVDASDKFAGYNDVNGNPVIVKLDGTKYAFEIEGEE